MREALARSDRDFAQAPRRARARAIEIRDRRGGEHGGQGLRLHADLRSKSPLPCCWPPRPAPSSGTLVLQTSRHPAPFFARGSRYRPRCRRCGRVPDQVSLPALPPIPPPLIAVLRRSRRLPRSSGRAARDIGRLDPLRRPAAPARGAPASAPSPRLAPVVITPPPQQDPHPQPARSAIGDLIRLGDMPPIPPALVAKVEPSRLVTSGQRALAKLGYGPMKADGVLGPSTRQAIERFERDRRLTVTGDFAPRTARELAAASGLPVEWCPACARISGSPRICAAARWKASMRCCAGAAPRSRRDLRQVDHLDGTASLYGPAPQSLLRNVGWSACLRRSLGGNARRRGGARGKVRFGPRSLARRDRRRKGRHFLDIAPGEG